MTAAWAIRNVDVRDGLRQMPAESVQCVVTSPPYWGLRDYGLEPDAWADGWVGCLGLEPTPEQYIVHMLEVFAEVWRVMRPDGTLWLNIGDSYAGSRRGGGHGGPRLQGGTVGQELSRAAAGPKLRRV